MEDSRDLKQLDDLLASACGILSQASSLQKALKVPPEREVLKSLGDALMRIWDAREHIFLLRPDLKPEFMQASEDNPEAYRQFLPVSLAARRLEQEGNIAGAVATYEAYIQATPQHYFRQLAEARANALRANT